MLSMKLIVDAKCSTVFLHGGGGRVGDRIIGADVGNRIILVSYSHDFVLKENVALHNSAQGKTCILLYTLFASLRCR